MIEMHIRWMELWKSKLGISDYGVAWIAFLKGLVIGLLVYHFLIAAQWERYGEFCVIDLPLWRGRDKPDTSKWN